MMRRAGRTGALALLASAIVVLSILVPGAFARSETLAPSAPPSSTGTAPAIDLSAVYDSPFSERAGFAAWEPAAIPGAPSATGQELIVVTFEPSDPTLFSAPDFGGIPMTIPEIADEFGLSTAQYDAAAEYFESEGLSVAHAWPDRLSLSLEGPVAAVDRAFGTSERSGIYDGRPVTFPATAPSLPASIETRVASVLGLSTGFDTFTLPVTPAIDAPTTLTTGSAQPAANSPITPAILRQGYDISPLYNLTSSPTYASSEGIAVLLWGDGYAPSDLSSFYSQYYPSGFPQPHINAYPVDGAPAPSENALNDPDKSAPQELTLDLEWSGSFAPGATIDAVYAPEGPPPDYSPSSSSMADALHEAITLPGVSVLSMSFGTPESGDSGLAAAWSTDLAEAAKEGITMLAATGDLGGTADSDCSGGASVDYPSTNPDVLAVGGTVVSVQQNLLGQPTGISESAWVGSGGGYSSQYSAPAWQPYSVTGSSARAVPDVSASASGNFLYYAGQEQEADGTSFATPLWAGLIAEMDALHGSSFGLVSPRLYAIGENEQTGGPDAGFNDITAGGNCVANAGPGWDAATGWGTPKGLVLYEALTATFVNLSISVDPAAVAPAGSVTVAAHLANATTGAPIPGVPVQISLASDEDFGPCTGSFGSADPLTNASGDVAVSMSVPACYLGSRADASVTVISNGYYGENSTTVPVNLLALVPALEVLTVYPYNVFGFVVIMAIASTIGGVLGARRPSSRSGPPPVPSGEGPMTAPPPAPTPAETPGDSPPVAPPAPEVVGSEPPPPGTG